MRIAEGWQPERTLYFVFGQDEEVGGPEGARFIAETLEKRGIERFAFVMDESAPLVPGLFPGLPDNTALIGIAQKGCVSLEPPHMASAVIPRSRPRSRTSASSRRRSPGWRPRSFPVASIPPCGPNTAISGRNRMKSTSRSSLRSPSARTER